MITENPLSNNTILLFLTFYANVLLQKLFVLTIYDKQIYLRHKNHHKIIEIKRQNNFFCLQNNFALKQ